MTVSEVSAGLIAMVEETLMRVMEDTVQRGREPTDAVMFTPGLGAHCRERLPGTDTPALSYLLLGALRGWADADRNTRVSAAEALRHIDLLLRAGAHKDLEQPRPQARGSDLTLARGVSERGPSPTASCRPARRSTRRPCWPTSAASSSTSGWRRSIAAASLSAAAAAATPTARPTNSRRGRSTSTAS
ncbi:hypothetical protein [Nannocystis pusilla]|uniref:hypothetical protein n=1 Tax=Nannocystis pusilla TaxID=889268 RepID=UPI003B793D07